ncbi:peptidoglycan DD-metalloendopeptidase family protein [Agrococcus sp. GCM10030264]|uniref:M23 family metallopeptidase n=1 Tax=Agrococcus sp. GCM10030264 TaxID=3273377 RepID=UPI00360BBAE1
MTRKDEPAPAGADAAVPSTRRSRRDGEREAELRALYADRPEQPSPMRVVDGGAPMYRTRREMRESASRLAHDLPVIVEPTVSTPAAEPADAPQPASPVTGGRRARRIAERAVEPAAQPSIAATSEPVPSADVAANDLAAGDAAPSRRARRVSASAVPAADAALPVVATSVDVAATAPVAAQAPAVDEAAPVALAATTPAASTPPTAATASDVPGERLMTRAERRAATAASSDEVSAAVAAVLGGEQADAASTPVRSPLHREARAPRPAVVARRPVALAPVVRPSRRVRSNAARKVVQRLGAAGVILAIGSLVAVTSLPAQALAPNPAVAGQAFGDVQVEQELDVTSGSGAHGDEEITAVLSREDFNVDDEIASTRLDAEELAALQVVADGDEIGPYYDGEPSMPGVWAQLETSYTQSPFPSLAEVPVSSGFGYRWGSFHGGVDLIPGAGTPVYPVANGVVVAIWQGNNPGGGGYEVIVEHNIDGEFFQSWYPHMQAGSILVEEGQVVDIGTQLGAVGSTGRSTGAHLHLEIKNGDYISVDPLVWLATREQILEP